MVDSFRLPETVPGSERIGKEPITHATSERTQVSAEAESTPVEGTVVTLSTAAPPGEVSSAERTRIEEVGNPV